MTEFSRASQEMGGRSLERGSGRRASSSRSPAHSPAHCPRTPRAWQHALGGDDGRAAGARPAAARERGDGERRLGPAPRSVGRSARRLARGRVRVPALAHAATPRSARRGARGRVRAAAARTQDDIVHDLDAAIANCGRRRAASAARAPARAPPIRRRSRPARSPTERTRRSGARGPRRRLGRGRDPRRARDARRRWPGAHAQWSAARPSARERRRARGGPDGVLAARDCTGAGADDASERERRELDRASSRALRCPPPRARRRRAARRPRLGGSRTAGATRRGRHRRSRQCRDRAPPAAAAAGTARRRARGRWWRAERLRAAGRRPAQSRAAAATRRDRRRRARAFARAPAARRSPPLSQPPPPPPLHRIAPAADAAAGLACDDDARAARALSKVQARPREARAAKKGRARGQVDAAGCGEAAREPHDALAAPAAQPRRAADERRRGPGRTAVVKLVAAQSARRTCRPRATRATCCWARGVARVAPAAPVEDVVRATDGDEPAASGGRRARDDARGPRARSRRRRLRASARARHPPRRSARRGRPRRASRARSARRALVGDAAAAGEPPAPHVTVGFLAAAAAARPRCASCARGSTSSARGSADLPERAHGDARRRDGRRGGGRGRSRARRARWRARARAGRARRPTTRRDARVPLRRARALLVGSSAVAAAAARRAIGNVCHPERGGRAVQLGSARRGAADAGDDDGGGADEHAPPCGSPRRSSARWPARTRRRPAAFACYAVFNLVRLDDEPLHNARKLIAAGVVAAPAARRRAGPAAQREVAAAQTRAAAAAARA